MMSLSRRFRLGGLSAYLWPTRGYATTGPVTIQLQNAFKGHIITPPEESITVESSTMIDLYTKMTTIRRLETTSDQLYKAKLIKGFLHLYSGQEAVATGVESVVRREDAVITAYRDHAFAWLRGCSLYSILAELLGKKDGMSGGKGGSMHMYNGKQNFFGGNGIVGAHIPVGAGVALAQKYQGTDNLTFVYFGDGAANQGQLFETINMAALWKLPVVFVCENNHYGMGTSTTRAHAARYFYELGDYLPGLWVDGMDVLAVRKGAEFACEYVRSGKGPLMIEMETYRYVGHSMSDPGTSYRSREEVQGIREKRDCIARIKNQLITLGIATEDELKEIDKQIRKEVDDAVKLAKAAPFPGPEELVANIYQEPTTARGVELTR